VKKLQIQKKYQEDGELFEKKYPRRGNKKKEKHKLP